MSAKIIIIINSTFVCVLQGIYLLPNDQIRRTFRRVSVHDIIRIICCNFVICFFPLSRKTMQCLPISLNNFLDIYSYMIIYDLDLLMTHLQQNQSSTELCIGLLMQKLSCIAEEIKPWAFKDKKTRPASVKDHCVLHKWVILI